jgi:hypothetical protein
MQTIEFEAIAHEHTIRIPDTVPDGVRLRVLLKLDETTASFPEQAPQPSDSAEGKALKALLAAMPDVGDDEDFSRPLDYGRKPVCDF